LKNSEKKRTFMDGSASQNSYLKMGQVGNMAVGLKVLGLAPSEAFGVEGQTAFVYRIRVAPDNTKQEPYYTTPADAFPHVEWKKSDEKRASNGVAIVFPISLLGASPEGAETLLAQLEGNFSERVYTDIATQLGEECISDNRETIIAYLDEEIGIFCQLLKKFIEGKTSAVKAFSEDGETLSFMEKSIKDALNSKKPTIH